LVTATVPAEIVYLVPGADDTRTTRALVEKPVAVNVPVTVCVVLAGSVTVWVADGSTKRKVANVFAPVIVQVDPVIFTILKVRPAPLKLPPTLIVPVPVIDIPAIKVTAPDDVSVNVPKLKVGELVAAAQVMLLQAAVAVTEKVWPVFVKLFASKVATSELVGAVVELGVPPVADAHE